MLNQVSCTFNVTTEFQSLCFAQFSLRLLARLFIGLMVHPSTLFTGFTGRWSCAITIQASTAVEIVFKLFARTVLPLETFLQLFFFQRFRTENCETVWDFLPFGSRSVVVLITIFYHGFPRAYLHKDISRKRKINSSD